MADIFNMTDTWNSAPTTFTAIKMDVTDTASAAASLLMDLLVGGVPKFQIDKSGNVDVIGTIANHIIGTDIQAYDATLASIAALGTGANVGLYATGVDTWAEFALTAAGRAILDDADAAAQRVTLGLAALATLATVGTTEIDDNAITLAKMAHGTDGNLITYDAAGAPAFVATGTAGQVLTSNGAGAAPTMQDAAGGAWSAGTETVISAQATADFSVDLATYKEVRFAFRNVIPATDDVQLDIALSVNSGSTYDVGLDHDNDPLHVAYSGSSGKLAGGGSTGDGIGSGATEDGVTGYLSIWQTSGKRAQFIGHFVWEDAGGSMQGCVASGYATVTTALTNVRFLFDAGNLESGTIQPFYLTG